MRLRIFPLTPSWRAACIGGLLALAACAAPPLAPPGEPLYALPTISDAAPAEPRLARVVLRRGGNVIDFINAPLREGGEWVTLARVEVLRQETPGDSLRPNGVVEFPIETARGRPARGNLRGAYRAIEARYVDPSPSALSNRYVLRAYTEGGALVPLPVLYATTDGPYARAVEAQE